MLPTEWAGLPQESRRGVFVLRRSRRSQSARAGTTRPTRIYGGGEDTGQGRQYDVAPDGRFLINTELPGNAAPITLIQHWQPGN